MLELFLTIVDKTDSRALYDELKQYGLNVTDIGSRTFVYGSVKDQATADKVFYLCGKYGTIE